MPEAEHVREKTTQFLHALTELSRSLGIGITGEPTLFLMDRDDYDRLYKIDGESKLAFD